MQRKEMILECSKLWNEIGRFVEARTGTPVGSLKSDTTLEEVGITGFSFDDIREGLLEDFDEHDRAEIAGNCETMKDIYECMCQDFTEKYDWEDDECRISDFLSECVIRHAHPAKTMNGITFAKDDIPFDVQFDLGFGFDKSDVDAVIDEINKKYGILVPKDIYPDDMLWTLFDKTVSAV